jgi:hypothetical protein
MWEAFGRLLEEDCWSGKMNCWREIAEGKRIAEGELLASLRAKILWKLKRTFDSQCKSSPRTLYIGFRKAKLKKS